MSIITIKDLTFAYDGRDNVFENVNLRLDTTWRLGFTGRNGRGKTTLLRLLSGEYKYRGSIISPVRLKYFPYTVENPGETVFDIIKRLCSGHEDWEIERELSLIDVDPAILNRPYSTLSEGERTKSLLSAMFLGEDCFPLIDEPTNHLDLRGRRAVSEYLRNKTGFILVSHDRAFLDGCIDHVLSINKTDIEIQKGNFTSWLVNKEMRDNFELAENEKLKKEISRLREASLRSGEWAQKGYRESTKGSGSGQMGFKEFHRKKAEKLANRSSSLKMRQDKAIAEKSALLKNIETADELKLIQSRYHAKQMITLSDVSIYYGGRAVCSGVNLAIENGERVALRGRNGSGKSSLISLICGSKPEYSGEISIAPGLIISRVEQDAAKLSGNLGEYAEQYNIDGSLFRAILRKLDFSRDQFDMDIQHYSSGQKKKVLLARSLCEQAHILIWDEPLNYIDVISRIQIEELLLKYNPTILFVEHDSTFCEKIATKEVVIY